MVSVSVPICPSPPTNVWLSNVPLPLMVTVETPVSMLIPARPVNDVVPPLMVSVAFALLPVIVKKLLPL